MFVSIWCWESQHLERTHSEGYHLKTNHFKLSFGFSTAILIFYFLPWVPTVVTEILPNPHLAESMMPQKALQTKVRK